MIDIKFPTGCIEFDVTSLVPYARNPKDHTEKDIDLIIRSIKRNGWGDPILICPETMEVLSGNGRLLAAKKLGLEKIPGVYAPDGLTEKQKADLVIASNKLVEVSGYNDNLGELIADFDLDADDFDLDLGDLSVEEPAEKPDVELKKIKITIAYEDSREVIDNLIRVMNEQFPELMTKVEIGD